MSLRIRNLFRRRRLDRELDAELRHHLESLEAEHRARGCTPEEARLAARRDLGPIAQIQEAHREQRGLPPLETLWMDVRIGLRSMRRTALATCAVIATLAIAIGANTMVFSVVDGVLIEPLPYPDADRLISVAHSPDLGSAPYLYFTEREENRTLEGIGAYNAFTATVTGRGEPEEVRSLLATSEILPILGIPPMLGRYFSARDDAPGSPNTVVLTYGYWQRRLGGDPSIVGQPLTIDAQPWTVIGVMPRAFRFLDTPVDVIMPFRLNPAEVRSGNFFLVSLARLAPGVTLEQAAADVRRMIPMAADRFPPPPGFTREQMRNAPLSPHLRPLKEAVVGDAGRALWVVMGTIGLVLLIACANVANLLLVRTSGRRQELAVRAALGAGRRRIWRQLLTESTVLSVTGGMLGVAFAYAGLRILRRVAPGTLPRLDEIAIDPGVLIFALVLSVGVGLLLGWIPGARHAGSGISAALRAEGRSSSHSRDTHRLGGILVVTQVALALVLLIGAGLMIRTFQQLSRVDVGFRDGSKVQTAQITVPFASMPDPVLVARRQYDILQRIAAIPGVEDVAFTSRLPMGGGFSMTDLLFPEGRTFSDGERATPRHFRFISPQLFDTLRVRLVAGRDLTWTDVFDRRPVVLISENLARAEWGGPRAALGKRLRGSSAADQWREIVGIVGDVRDSEVSEPPQELVYFPVLVEDIYNSPTYVWRSVRYVIRSPRTGTPGFLDEVRQAVWATDPDLPLVDVRTMGDVLDRSMARTSFVLLMLAIAGAMALVLGVIGIYAVMAYAVSQRTREVGIRIALGARRTEVIGMFVRRGLVLTALGVAAGLASAAVLTRSMSSLLFEVRALDPGTYALVTVGLVAAAALASYLPLRRAAGIDPIDTLRAE
jgi:predicted permease